MKEKHLISFLGLGLLGLILAVVAASWWLLIRQGRRFALRDRLRRVDAMVVLAGTRGQKRFLDGKIQTAARLYHEGWASLLICSGRFSMKVTDHPQLIPLEALHQAVAQGRLQPQDVARAAQTWDLGLGAGYMRDQARQLGVPPEAILVEDASLHTRENAECTLALLKQRNVQSILLVTSPFHQLRTSLTFAKVFAPEGIEILNYYADTGEWHPATWFFSAEHRRLVKSETERILHYRRKGDLL
jgi:uncharacterized SAM-binding protein YcdF (DUF218 family)